jgi:excisionase family DNA binding protein
MSDREEEWSEGAKTIREAADFLRCGRTKLYAMIAAGEIVYSRVGKNRVVSVRSLKRLLASKTVEVQA